ARPGGRPTPGPQLAGADRPPPGRPTPRDGRDLPVPVAGPPRPLPPARKPPAVRGRRERLRSAARRRRDPAAPRRAVLLVVARAVDPRARNAGPGRGARIRLGRHR